MAGTLYDYLQGGPTLSGFKQQTGSLSGVMPGALSQGYQRGMQLPATAPGGTYGFTPGAMGGQSGQVMPRSVATSLSPNLMQTFGVYGASQTPQWQAGEQAARNVPYYGLSTQPSWASQQANINDILSRIGASTPAEQQQIASNRQPGETAFETAARMQMSPQTLATSLLSGGLGAYNTLGGIQDFVQNQTLTGGLGTAASGLRTLSSLGNLAGLDPTAMAGLSLGGSLAGLGSTLTNPAVMGAFSVPQSALPSIGGSAPQLGLASGANIAGGALGVGGAVNNLMGGDPRLGAALNLGSSLASTGGAMAAGAAGGLGSTLSIAALPWAIGGLISSFTSAAHQAKLKEKMGLAKESMAALKANMPQTQAALKALATGDMSQLGFLTDQYKIAQQGREGLGYVGKGPTTPFDKYSVQLFNAIQKANPAAYEQALRMGFGKYNYLNKIYGADPAYMQYMLGNADINKAPIERIYELMGYGAPRQSSAAQVAAQLGVAPGQLGGMFAPAPMGSAPGPIAPEWGYMAAPSKAWPTYQYQYPFGGANPAAMSDERLRAILAQIAGQLSNQGSSGFRPVGGGGAAGPGGAAAGGGGY